MKKLIKTVKYYDDGSQDTVYHSMPSYYIPSGPHPTVYCPRCNHPRHNPFDYGIRTTTCFCDTNSWFSRYVTAYKAD